MEEGALRHYVHGERGESVDELPRELDVEIADLPSGLRHLRGGRGIDPEDARVNRDLSAAQRARRLRRGQGRLLEKCADGRQPTTRDRRRAFPRHIDTMPRADGRRVVVRDSRHAGAREVARLEVELWRDVSADDEESAPRKTHPLHVRDDALEERDRSAAVVRHGDERLSDCGVRGEALGVSARVADENAPSAQVADLPEHLDSAAERADALSARIRHDDDVVRESSAHRRDDRPVSLCLRRVRGRDDYEVEFHLLVAATSPAPYRVNVGSM